MCIISYKCVYYCCFSATVLRAVVTNQISSLRTYGLLSTTALTMWPTISYSTPLRQRSCLILWQLQCRPCSAKVLPVIPNPLPASVSTWSFEVFPEKETHCFTSANIIEHLSADLFWPIASFSLHLVHWWVARKETYYPTSANSLKAQRHNKIEEQGEEVGKAVGEE